MSTIGHPFPMINEERRGRGGGGWGGINRRILIALISDSEKTFNEFVDSSNATDYEFIPRVLGPNLTFGAYRPVVLVTDLLFFCFRHSRDPVQSTMCFCSSFVDVHSIATRENNRNFF